MNSYLTPKTLEYDTAAQAVEVRLPYRPRAKQLVLALFFFGAAGAFFTFWAGNHRGLDIDGLVTLDPAHATVAKMVLAFASIGMFLFGLLFLVPQSLRRNRQIVLDRDAIHVPVWHGWTGASDVVDASQIRRVRVIRLKHATCLRLHHPGGVARINSSHLIYHGEIETILEWLGRRRPDLFRAH